MHLITLKSELSDSSSRKTRFLEFGEQTSF